MTEETLVRLVERGRFVVEHNGVFFPDEIKWCWRLDSGVATLSDPEHAQALLELRRPEHGGELTNFTHAVNRSRPSLPELVEIETLLNGLLEDCPRGRKRSCRATDRRLLTTGDWMD